MVLVYSIILFIFAHVLPAFCNDDLLKITFPADGDTFNTSRLRISGKTRPGTDVYIENTKIRSFSSGAFVTVVPIQPGENRIHARTLESETSVSIYREPPVETSPEYPLAIDSRMFKPKNDVWLMPGDYLRVQFKGSPSGYAKFRLGKQSFPMQELPASQMKDVAGIYSGLAKISSGMTNKSLDIDIELVGQKGDRIRSKTPGQLFILSDKNLLLGFTHAETDLWNSPEGGSRIAHVHTETPVLILGKDEKRYKIKLSDNRTAFVEAQNVSNISLAGFLPHTEITSPIISFDRNWLKFSLNTSHPVPYTITHDFDPLKVELKLYGAYRGSEWTTFPNQNLEIKSMSLAQTDAGCVTFSIVLDQDRHWGHDVQFEAGRIHLYIRRSPYSGCSLNSPFTGLAIAIDAGHGGDNTGAISPTGLEEKDVNFEYATHLAELLRAAGARVVLTRRQDKDVELDQRVAIAREFNAHILLSLHNNATGPATNPLRAKGTSVYYYQEQSRDLAWSIYPHLVDLGLEPFGRIYTPFALTRTSEMLSVLIEGVFMTNPTDEMLLLRNDFPKRFARKVYQGLEAFLLQTR